MNQAHNVVFWRDSSMPYIELRKVADGRRVCYAPHSHNEWSLGLITAGESTFVYGDELHHVSAGDLILINPDKVHACNPVAGRAWAYLMMYVATDWLAAMRNRLALQDNSRWHDLGPAVLRNSRLANDYQNLAEVLLDTTPESEHKQQAVESFLSDLMKQSALASPSDSQAATAPVAFRRLANWIDHHANESISLRDLCTRSGLSATQVIRGFRLYFHLTPHAYLVNRRIQQGQRSLRHGAAIADAAQDAGFADQPHFQRTFKRLLATTPARYRLAKGRRE